MAYFITEGELKILTTLSSNVDSHIIAPYFKQSEDIYITPLLGIPLFEDLKTKQAANTLNPVETKLMDEWLKPCCAHFLLYQAFPFIQEKLTNKGVVQKTSEQSTPVAETTLKGMQQILLNTADFYKRKVYEYIIENKASFPLFYDAECKVPQPNSLIAFDEPKARFAPRQKWNDYY